MKILVVCSGNVEDFSLSTSQPFITEQTEVINSEYGVQFDFFIITGRGIFGYLSNLLPLLRKIKKNDYDVVHAHYGYSGLLAVMQRYVPVLITFHGSDLNEKQARKFSLIARKLATKCIYVSEQLTCGIKLSSKDVIIPCGVNLDVFSPLDKLVARQELGFDMNKNYILFASSFDNPIKNSFFAKAVCSSLSRSIELLELKNYDRATVSLLLNAADLLLLTSFSEGSPQIIKEAMACNCPIVTNDVGDIKDRVLGTKNCYVQNLNLDLFHIACDKILDNPFRTDGRKKISNLDNLNIARKIYKIYTEISKGYDNNY